MKAIVEQSKDSIKVFWITECYEPVVAQRSLNSGLYGPSTSTSWVSITDACCYAYLKKFYIGTYFESLAILLPHILKQRNLLYNARIENTKNLFDFAVT